MVYSVCTLLPGHDGDCELVSEGDNEATIVKSAEQCLIRLIIQREVISIGVHPSEAYFRSRGSGYKALKTTVAGCKFNVQRPNRRPITRSEFF